MGWRPVEWAGSVLPEAKFEKKCTSFFEIFGFERPMLRYLLKKVLHCKGSGIWLDAITQVSQCACQFLPLKLVLSPQLQARRSSIRITSDRKTIPVLNWTQHTLFIMRSFHGIWLLHQKQTFLSGNLRATFMMYDNKLSFWALYCIYVFLSDITLTLASKFTLFLQNLKKFRPTDLGEA